MAAWRSTTSATARATSGSRCCPTGSTPPTEHADGDDELLAAAAAGIDRLNERHGEAPGGGARFLLFHRGRRWNAGRGPLDGLGAQARQARGAERAAARLDDDAASSRPLGRRRLPPTGVRYVVTLDADTRLPRGRRRHGWSARSPTRSTSRRFDAGAGRVDRRLRRPPAADHADAARREHDASIFQRVVRRLGRDRPVRVRRLGRLPGPVPARAASPARGSTTSTRSRPRWHDRVPENALLSHDLFEGIFARAGLVTDVELFDEFPSNYLVAAARQHRWARGDWQLLPWILGRARDATATAAPGARSRGIARWKMVDNLRRTLVRAAGARDPRRRLDDAVGVRRRWWTAFVARVDDRARRAAGARRAAAAPAGASRSAATCATSATTSVVAAAQVGARTSRSSPTRRG